MSSPRLLVLLTTALVALFAAGCGSSDDNSASSDNSGAGASTDAASSGSGEVDITMRNTSFDPKSATAKVGQKVVWKNEDGFDHNVKADSGEDFKSDNFGKDGTFEYTVDKPGTIKYECTIHPGMTGTLTVTQ